MFQKPKVEDVVAQIKGWEDENQKDLRKLAGLIEKIVGVVRDGGRNAVLRYDGIRDSLVVSRVDGEKIMLPKDLYFK